MITRRLFCASLFATPAIVSSSSLFAQDFPARHIRLIVPYAAGGGTDTIARLVAHNMGEKLGQTVVVENIATAGGNIATQTAANAAPDGYTILMANQGPIAVNPHLFKSLKVDTLTAFAPITLIAAAPLVVVVPQKSEFKTFKQLVEFAKSNPGKLTYGSAGNGSASHLATVLLNVVAGIDTLHVPYRGAGPAMSDLLGGQDAVHDHHDPVGQRADRKLADACARGHQQAARSYDARMWRARRKRLGRLRGECVVRLRRAEGYATGADREIPEGYGRRDQRYDGGIATLQ